MIYNEVWKWGEEGRPFGRPFCIGGNRESHDYGFDLRPAEWPRDYDSLDHERDIENGDTCGLMTDLASACGPSIQGMWGPTTSPKDARRMAPSSASSPSSMRPAGNAWRLSSRVSSSTRMFWRLWPTCYLVRSPAHIRSDNGSEFIATAVQKWLGPIGIKTL